MAETVEMKDFEKEMKKRNRRKWIQDKLDAASDWYDNNREFAMVAIPAAGALVVAIVKGGINLSKHAMRTHNLKKEEDLKELYCYDRSLGHYWQLRRKLTNAEWVEIDRRKKHGERLADILEELKVLK